MADKDELDNILDDALNDFEEDTPQTKSESSDDTEQKTQPPNNEQMVENMNRVFEMMSENIENMGDDTDAMFDEIFQGLDNEEGGFDGLLDGLMNQILAKEVLYEPFKEMRDMYPKFLSDSKDKLTPEEYQTYSNQMEIIDKIVKEYEGEENSEKIIALLDEMQNSGQMPEDIVKNLASGIPGMPGMPGMPPMPGMPGMDGKNCTIS